MMRNKALAWMMVIALGGLMLGGCNGGMKKENEALWKENQELHDELKNARDALDAANAEQARLQQELANAMSAKSSSSGGSGLEGLEGEGVEVDTSGRDPIIRVAGDVLFDSGQATLKSTFKSKIRQIASALNSGGNQIRIEGHSDSDPIRKSKWRDNYHLSEARALAVRDELAAAGVDRARMSIVGYGPDKPRASNNSRTGKAQNRRVEIVVITP